MQMNMHDAITDSALLQQTMFVAGTDAQRDNTAATSHHITLFAHYQQQHTQHNHTVDGG